MNHITSQPAAAWTGAEPGTETTRVAARRRMAARLAHFRSQDGLVPVCSWCRKVRNRVGAWTPVEQVLLDGAGMTLTHGVCPDCAQTLLAKPHDAA
ncbi:MAG TPA: hypothetical protein VGJ89_04340 [Geothrix sp.]|jgi:hypothetical protein